MKKKRNRRCPWCGSRKRDGSPPDMDCVNTCADVKRLKEALWSMWDQFACTATDGCDCAGCSALEDAADALGIETA